MGCHVRSQMVYFHFCLNEGRDLHLRVENLKIQYLRNSLFYEGIQLWNELTTKLRLINNFKIFKKEL
jgi:hypothetical protein